MATIIPETVFQSEINECGLACIAMLAETQGKDITLQMLRERYPASAHGTSLDRLSTILLIWRFQIIRSCFLMKN